MPNAAIARLLLFGLLIPFLTAHLTSQAQNNFEWKDASGKTHNRSELQEILQKHEKWIHSEGKSGTRADLSRANLSEANLSHVNLSEAYLSQANLARANLSYTNLSRAKLDYANLDGASLIDAHVDGADLTNTNLFGANLTNTHLNQANLANVRLVEANLTNAILYNTILTDADLRFANLARAKIRFRADLSAATVESGNFERTVFEPNSLPDISGMSLAKNLELLTYENNPVALVQLRKQFEDGGFSEQGRKITYALKRRETELSWVGATSRELPGAPPGFEVTLRPILSSSNSILANFASFILNTVFFDWTCQYGMSPGRPLILGVVLWFLCSLLYFACIHASGEAGLYRFYSQSIHDDPSTQRRIKRISWYSRLTGAAMALSIFLARIVTLGHFNVFQPDERIQYWVPGHQFWTLVTVADATRIRPQGCRVGEGDCGVAIADQRVFACPVGSNVFWPAVWVGHRLGTKVHLLVNLA